MTGNHVYLSPVTTDERGRMLTVHADNDAGIACYKKAGFREVARLPEWVFKDGKYVDKLYMGIMEDQFKG